MARNEKPDDARWKRLMWFALIWLSSVAALGLAAIAMRMLMRLAGLTAD